MGKRSPSARPSIRVEGSPRAPSLPPRSPSVQAPLARRIEEISVLDREPGQFCVARWKNVVTQAWAAQANAVSIARLRRALTPAQGLGVRSSISIIAEGLPPPTAEASAGFVELMNSGANEIACLGVVVQGEGFASSSLRSSLTRMRLATTRSYEMAVTTTIEELVPWLLPRHVMRTGVELDAAGVCEFVRWVEQRALSTAPNASPARTAG